jgi:predicted DNA repair protein MutK
MAVGLIALLDDVAALAKVAAASLDDVAGQAAKAGVKAAGVVIDDAAVTPRYVVGFAAERELPIVWRIAVGSLKNKMLFLLPAALLLSWLAPWIITPLLMLGGAYLCYEGTEKVYEAVFPHKAHEHEAKIGAKPQDAAAQEAQKIASAIKTDFILSAEIMAITLAALPEGQSFWMKAAVLAVVGLGITVAVYGAVALIVKADDAGVALAKSTSTSLFGSLSRGVGRALVVGMPYFLKLLAVVGTAAMIWVGGGIIVHGLAHYGFSGLEHAFAHASEATAQAVPAVGGLAGWLVTAAGSGVVGLIVGAALIPLASHVLAPAWSALSGLFGKAKPAVDGAPNG